jgi:hypothetical protein
MPVPLTCACGAHFEVADSLASLTVRCPECQRELRVPSGKRLVRKTSGYALASAILSLVGLFTVVLTAAGVLCGIAGLVSIRRHRDRVTGTGYAVFGIVAGLVGTGLTLFALNRDELFDGLRERIAMTQADYSGPLEIVDQDEGFAITRPSVKWGVNREGLAEAVGGLLLVNLAREAYLQVNVKPVEPAQALEKCRDDVLSQLRNAHGVITFERKQARARISGFAVEKSQRLPAARGMEILEVLLDLRLAGRPYRYLIWVCRRPQGDQLYVVSGWVLHRHFDAVEPELRQAFGSFRLLDEK